MIQVPGSLIGLDEVLKPSVVLEHQRVLAGLVSNSIHHFSRVIRQDISGGHSLPDFDLALVRTVMRLVNLLQQALHLEDIAGNAVEAVTNAALGQSL